MILRPEQREVVDKAKMILAEKGIVYIAAQVRTGKNIMSLTVAKESVKRQYNKVLFVTKKKAISGVEADYNNIGFVFEQFTLTNFEQVSKLQPEYDLVICDETHSIGAYAKPSKRAKDLKKIIGNADLILMSGTPTPESYSQIFHQFWISPQTPFKETNFYKWAKVYVIVGKKYFNGIEFNDYSKAKEQEIKSLVDPYMVTLSQEEAGFTSFVEEEILTVTMHPGIYKIMDTLKKKKVYKSATSGTTIIADTPVRLQSLFHQLSSGTVKIEDKRYSIDTTKAFFIQGHFKGLKIAIFYKFIQEGEMLKTFFPVNTADPQVFNSNSEITFICQMVSGREGVNLSTADAMVMFNIDFSATTYWQVRARMQTKDRVKKSPLFWIFSDNGIERYIYKVVTQKKNFTKKYFEKTLEEWSPDYRPELLNT